MASEGSSSWAGYRALFRDNPDFRRLFLARTVSLFGDWFHLMAVLALLRQMGVHTAGSFGWILILKAFPGALIAPVAGMMADRFSRRRLMIASDLLRALVVLLMLGQMWWPSVAVLYGLVALISMLSAFFEPARSAMLPDVVSKEELTAANALGAATWSAMLTLGSAAGGVWTAYFGWQAALLMDAASFLLSIFFLWKLQEPPFEAETGPPGGGLLHWLGIPAILAGFAYMARRPRVWSLSLVKFGWTLSMPSALLLAILGERVYAVPAFPILAVTVLYVARGFGTGLGPFLARGLSQNQPAAMEKMILLAFLCAGFFYMLLPLLAGSLWLAIFFVFFAHLGGATVWVFSTIRLQQTVPTQWRGRVFATQLMAFTFSSFCAVWSFGRLVDGELLSPTGVVHLGAGMLLGMGLLWGLRGAWLGWAQEEVEDSEAQTGF